jgi:hypothetical protein
MASAETCSRCALEHEPNELFVAIGHEVVVDTCQLAAAYEAAHAQPARSGSFACHATHPSALAAVLRDGLDPSHAHSPCKHVALAQTPGIAAGVLLPLVNGVPTLGEGCATPVVFEVDISGLDLFFELGEARHHGGPIDSDHLQILDPQPSADVSGWSDPMWRRNHSDCIAIRGYPLDRRLLNAAEDELTGRYPYDPFNDECFRLILDELAERT